MKIEENVSGPVLAYQIRNSLYLNITNACTADCVFCPRTTEPVVKGYDLRLARDPEPWKVIQAVGDPLIYDEIVFCGFGEPTLRLDALLEISRWLNEKHAYIRLNTNGHGNLIHKRSIVADLARVIDEVSVSLNAATAEEYERVMRTPFGREAFGEVIQFIRECRNLIPKVAVTAVDFPGFDVHQFTAFVEREFRLPVRIRAYNRFGD